MVLSPRHAAPTCRACVAQVYSIALKMALLTVSASLLVHGTNCSSVLSSAPGGALTAMAHALFGGVGFIVSRSTAPLLMKLACLPTSTCRLAILSCLVLMPGCWSATTVTRSPTEVNGEQVCKSQHELMQLHERVLAAEARAKAGEQRAQAADKRAQAAEERAKAAEAQVQACLSLSNSSFKDGRLGVRYQSLERGTLIQANDFNYDFDVTEEMMDVLGGPLATQNAPSARTKNLSEGIGAMLMHSRSLSEADATAPPANPPPPPGASCDHAVALSDGDMFSFLIPSIGPGPPLPSVGACPDASYSGIGPGFWLRISTPGLKRLTLSTCDSSSGLDTDLAVFRGSCDAFTRVACSGDAPKSGGCQPYHSELAFVPDASQAYYLVVSGFGGANGAVNITGVYHPPMLPSMPPSAPPSPLHLSSPVAPPLSPLLRCTDLDGAFASVTQCMDSYSYSDLVVSPLETSLGDCTAGMEITALILGSLASACHATVTEVAAYWMAGGCPFTPPVAAESAMFELCPASCNGAGIVRPGCEQPPPSLLAPTAPPMPPLVPGPDGSTTVITTEQLRAAIEGTPPLGNLSLYLPPGTVLPLGGTPIAVGPISLQLSSDGDGATIDAEHRSAVFALASGARLIVRTLALTNGRSTFFGGVATIPATVHVELLGCVLSNSIAAYGGGAVAAVGGRVTVSNGSTIINSTAEVNVPQCGSEGMRVCACGCACALSGRWAVWVVTCLVY